MRTEWLDQEPSKVEAVAWVVVGISALFFALFLIWLLESSL